MKSDLERYSKKSELKRERGSRESAALNLTIDDLHGGDVSQDAVSPKVARGAGTVGLCGGGGGGGRGTTCHGTPHTTVPPRYTRSVSVRYCRPQCFTSLFVPVFSILHSLSAILAYSLCSVDFPFALCLTVFEGMDVCVRCRFWMFFYGGSSR